ncbi:NAD-dependent deacetylase [Natronosporangium hydrolyticum]|uniref:protein acetyllysine N-acetyltransferase n=1 Tax=Natronosporangium hydrolyticum TaxID=2811111 RepID=A0A895YSD7_9ACTN|nr:Sir2 family NAD-dependent protein deacetylase [Natronosporangium hydrolyticum]QSB16928.1 NAD-dependent deacetylase [Natronosporangium hydrolyticum]
MSLVSTAEASTADWLRQAERVTVLTGAGVSTDSGIPDFRGPQGVWTKDPAAQTLFSLDSYLADPDVRRRAWQARLAHPVWHASPNPGHESLASLEHSGRLRALVTQNIDGLHQAAGSSPERVIEIHGTVHWVKCLTCEQRTPMPEVLALVEAGQPDPACPDCGGIQKSATISFGETLERDVLNAAVAAARDCDLFLAVGTSLSVHPAAGLCEYALVAGARLVIINAAPTPYDGAADALLRDPIGEVLPRLVAAAT